MHMPPMPTRVAAIRAAIETRQDFSVLADGGEAEVRAWAETHGLNGCALVLQWQAKFKQQQQADATRPVRVELLADDLDYWGDAKPAAPVDDEEDGEDDKPLDDVADEEDEDKDEEDDDDPDKEDDEV